MARAGRAPRVTIREMGQWRRRRRVGKVKPGDGSRLRPFRGWDVLTRSLFYLELPSTSGEPTPRSDVGGPGGDVWAVDVHHFADDDRAEVYREGAQRHRARLPADFPVPGGVIEVAVSTFGLTRMHYVTDGGEERPLRPHHRSLEGLRGRFGRSFPRASAWIARAAVVILLVGLAVALPQVAALVSRWDLVADRVGTFTSPIVLPGWANTTLFIAGILASLERALTLRSHWLVDAETWWLGD